MKCSNHQSLKRLFSFPLISGNFQSGWNNKAGDGGFNRDIGTQWVGWNKGYGNGNGTGMTGRWGNWNNQWNQQQNQSQMPFGHWQQQQQQQPPYWQQQQQRQTQNFHPKGNFAREFGAQNKFIKFKNVRYSMCTSNCLNGASVLGELFIYFRRRRRRRRSLEPNLPSPRPWRPPILQRRPWKLSEEWGYPIRWSPKTQRSRRP